MKLSLSGVWFLYVFGLSCKPRLADASLSGLAATELPRWYLQLQRDSYESQYWDNLCLQTLCSHDIPSVPPWGKEGNGRLPPLCHKNVWRHVFHRQHGVYIHTSADLAKRNIPSSEKLSHCHVTWRNASPLRSGRPLWVWNQCKTHPLSRQWRQPHPCGSLRQVVPPAYVGHWTADG